MRLKIKIATIKYKFKVWKRLKVFMVQKSVLAVQKKLKIFYRGKINFGSGSIFCYD